MSELTRTRKELRRLVATELQMPFFRRYSAQEGTIDAGSTTTKIIDAALTQTDGFWNGHWFYGISAGDVSIVRHFDASSRAFQLEVPMASTPNTGDKYELHSIWNAIEIHRAINRAILTGGRIFPQTIRDETLVLQEDKLTYDITGLSNRVFSISKVWVEDAGSINRGTATAGGASTITVVSVPSGINTNWKISIYDGTGKGQIRNYSSAAGLAITVNSAWTTQPDNTSKYAIWDATEELYDWRRLEFWYEDAKEFPDTLSFRNRLTSFYGMRLRIEYLFLPAELTSDASTCSIPEEYLLSKTCALLHAMKINDTKADQQLHFAEFDRHNKDADAFLMRFAQHNPDNTMRLSSDYAVYNDTDDPLGWNRNG